MRAETKGCSVNSIVQILDETTLEVPSTGTFKFDSILAPGTQEQVFEQCRDLIQSAIDGRNVTIFTYGQTGSGKTYTMYGTAEEEGIAPRAVSEVFKAIRLLHCTYDVKVTASMIELYKNKLSDLLLDSKTSPAPKLRVHDDTKDAVWIEGLSEVEAHDATELQDLLKRGVARRAQASHAMNRESSRSHLLFTIKIQTVNRSTGAMLQGKVVLCDLAGSERIKKTEVEGDRLREALDINKSLAALGNVITAVARKQKQVPYRSHQLTQIMRDSLGGTAKTMMFVNTSSSPSDLSQTVSSLAYAARASRIVNKGAAKLGQSR
jgi:hypothetical protein